MAVQHLAGVLDGGPHGDPREAEFEELLNDGEEEEKVGTGVHNDEEEWSEEEFDEKGVQEKGKKPTPKVEPEPEEEEEEKPKKGTDEPKKGEEEEPEAEPDKKPDKVSAKKEEPVEEEDPKTKYQKIPYDRFKKELLKRKELALRAVQAEERSRGLEARMEAFEKAAKAATDPEPDRNVDPFSHQEWRIRQLELKAAGEKKPEPKPRSAEFQTFLHDSYKESADEFRAEHPDFNDAYGFALQKTAEQILRQYPNATQDQISGAVRELEMNEVNASLTKGIDPAERVYEIAKALGYKVKEGEQKAGTKTDRVVEALATENAKKKSSSLATKGGGDTRKPLTIDDVEDMSNEELERFMDRNSGRPSPLRA